MIIIYEKTCDLTLRILHILAQEKKKNVQYFVLTFTENEPLQTMQKKWFENSLYSQDEVLKMILSKGETFIKVPSL